MKKSLVIILVVSFVLSLASTALAMPLDFNGDIRLQARSINDQIGGDLDKNSFFQFRFRLNVNGQLDDNTAFFLRFSDRNKVGARQTSSFNSLTNSSQGQFDQYGVKISADNWNFKIGRQDVILGQGTILKAGYDAAGVDNKFDGVVASTKSGNFDLSFVGGKTNAANLGVANNLGGVFVFPTITEWYGFDATTKLDKNLTAGFAYARQKPDDVALQGKNVWAVNTTFTPSNSVSFNGEYAKSNETSNNRAYFIAGTYSWDKDSFTVQYNNVQNNSVDSFNSGVGAVAYPFEGDDLTTGNTGYKGFTYVYSHPLSKIASFHLIYLDLKVDGKPGSDKEVGTGVVWKF